MTIMLGVEIMNFYNKSVKEVIKEFNTNIKGLNDDEVDVYKRARNAKVNSHPSNTDIITYKCATGLEAIFGYLYLTCSYERIDELVKYIKEN